MYIKIFHKISFYVVCSVADKERNQNDLQPGKNRYYYQQYLHNKRNQSTFLQTKRKKKQSKFITTPVFKHISIPLPNTEIQWLIKRMQNIISK